MREKGEGMAKEYCPRCARKGVFVALTMGKALIDKHACETAWNRKKTILANVKKCKECGYSRT